MTTNTGRGTEFEGAIIALFHLLITRHMASWTRLMAETIEWPLVWRGYAIVFAVNISLFTLGYAVFESRDLKS
jgi:ABC-2 type transport system permease protein